MDYIVYSPTSVSAVSPVYFADSTSVSPVYYADSPIVVESPVSIPYVTTEYSEPLLDSPVLTSVNLTFSKPAIGFYENMNVDPKLHERMVKHFYLYKTMGDWIYDELVDLLNYFYIGKDKKVHLIKSLDDYDETNIESDTEEMIEKKIDYLRANIFEKKHMKHILRDLVRERRINWYDLPKNEKKVRRAVKRFLQKRLQKMVRTKAKEKER